MSLNVKMMLAPQTTSNGKRLNTSNQRDATKRKNTGGKRLSMMTSVGGDSDESRKTGFPGNLERPSAEAGKHPALKKHRHKN